MDTMYRGVEVHGGQAEDTARMEAGGNEGPEQEGGSGISVLP